MCGAASAVPATIGAVLAAPVVAAAAAVVSRGAPASGEQASVQTIRTKETARRVGRTRGPLLAS
jgi:hypothetical protein